jgi:hypothetical protein
LHHAQPVNLHPARLSGKRVMPCPVAAGRALAMADATNATPSSPAPPGLSVSLVPNTSVTNNKGPDNVTALQLQVQFWMSSHFSRFSIASGPIQQNNPLSMRQQIHPTSSKVNHGNQEIRTLQLPVEKLRPTARRHGCLAV